MSDSPFAASARFTLTLPTVKHDFQVVAFKGQEHISQPYQISVELVSEDPNLSLSSVLHHEAFLRLDADGSGIHGQIYSIERGAAGKRLTYYTLTLGPRLAYLQHRFNQRIFQFKTVPEIVAQVLEEHWILSGNYRFDIDATLYPPREYCTQFDESDLDYIQRLCAAEGIHYHFEHSETGHVLVFADDQTGGSKLAPSVFNTDGGMVPEQTSIKRFSVKLQTRTSRVARRDYDFERPDYVLESHYWGPHPDADEGDPDLEDYRYPGHYKDEDRADLLVKRAHERHRHDHQLATGNSDVRQLRSGHFLDLKDHPTAENNQLWLLTSVTHEGKQPQVLEEFAATHSAAKGDFPQGYRNTFEAIPWCAPYRPPMCSAPHVKGSQSAVVTGPVGEEIYCDEYGRVKVQFHWDREGGDDEHTSCWLRVASSWAGAAYGSMVIPRIGMEVVVSFWEGNPDQPYVSGCVVNGRNTAPYALPANKTQSVFKTLSSPGGKGSNELKIEDRNGSEKVFIQAERDWEQLIKNTQTVSVGHERHDSVAGNSYTEFKADEHHTTQANRVTRVGAADHLEIGQSQHLKTALGHYVEAGTEIHLKAGGKVVIDAGTELTLRAGGSTLTLNPSGVWLNGQTVASNVEMEISTTSPAEGTGIQLLMAALPGAAMTSVPGAVPERALANSQMDLMKRPVKANEARCLICEACKDGVCNLAPAA